MNPKRLHLAGIPHELGQRLYRWRHRLATAAFLLLAAWLAVGVISGPNGWLAYRNKKIANRQLQQEVRQLQTQNQELERRVKALKEDPRAIETVAREQLHYAKPDEVIYVPQEKGTPSVPEPSAPAPAQKR